MAGVAVKVDTTTGIMINASPRCLMAGELLLAHMDDAIGHH
jgi:hypothetical protein